MLSHVNGVLASHNGNLSASDGPCCQCCTDCWGACINKEDAFRCFSYVNGQLVEVDCKPCGDPCFYNSVTPGFSYVCLLAQSREECESILNADLAPSVWLGCGSLQKECYYSACHGLWFPLHGTPKGGPYSLCDNPVASNEESPFYRQECDE